MRMVNFGTGLLGIKNYKIRVQGREYVMVGMANEIPMKDFYRPNMADMIISVVCVV